MVLNKRQRHFVNASQQVGSHVLVNWDINKYLKSARTTITDAEFESLKTGILETVLVGDDIYKNTDPKGTFSQIMISEYSIMYIWFVLFLIINQIHLSKRT